MTPPTDASLAASRPPDDDETPSAGSRPPVVAVMVAHDPGPWWDEALRSLAAQTYEDLTIIVLATAVSESITRVKARVDAAAPGAVVRALPGNVGFGPACNEVLEQVKGAAFYVFCHDDVRLDRGAISLLVEEAYRSNAGIVGPKVVSWDEPERLLQVGMNVDKFGSPSPQVERGELDQEQHDAVRDVFYVPGAVTLVRADLFASLGGFDPGIDLIGEDVDLCWRAHLAGARVLVAPQARVAHREALAERVSRRDRWSRAARHRLRTTLVCYRLVHRLRVLPQALIVSLIEALVAAVTGHLDHAAAVLGAWTASLRAWPGIRRRRRLLAGVRVVGDGEVRTMQVRGIAGATRFVHDRCDRDGDRVRRGGARAMVDDVRAGRSRPEALALLAIVLLLLLGLRDLLLSALPAIGQLVPFGDDAVGLFGRWSDGVDPNGLGRAAAEPVGLLGLGALGTLAFGSLSFARHVLVLGMIPLGLVGLWRLARPAGRRPVAIVAVAVYAALPVFGNSLATGRWTGLVLFGLGPWLLAQLAAVSADGPARDAGRSAAVAGDPRHLLRRVLTLGMLTALAAYAEPFAVVLVLVLAAAWAVGGVLAGRVAEAGRILAIAAGGAAVALVLALPWTLSLLSGGWVDTSGTGGAPVGPSALTDVVGFRTGPVAGSPLVLALLVAGVLPLLVARDERLVTATRGWTVAAVCWALVWLGAHGIADPLLPAPEVLLAPAAAGLALAVAMGVAAFQDDLPDYFFGWRQAAAIVAGLAVVVGMLPGAVATLGGRYEVPRGDLQPVLANLDPPPPGARTLWLGDASVVPFRAWSLDAPRLAETGSGRNLVHGTTTGVMPSVENLWAGSPQGPTEALTAALRDLRPGATTRLGEQLAPLGIAYIVVPRRAVPAPYAMEDTSNPEVLLDTLAGQLDLRRVDVMPGLAVYRNLAPVAAAPSPPTSGSPALIALPVALWLAAFVGRRRLRPRDTGPVIELRDPDAEARRAVVAAR